MSELEMRVLTVKQPWAWAILNQGKLIENRTRSLGPYRGPVAIHAGLRDDPAGYYDGTRDNLTGLARGVIIGVVDLVDVVRDSDSFWAEAGAVHHVLQNPRPLFTPIVYRGGLGLRRLPADVVARVLAATKPLLPGTEVSRITRRGGKHPREILWRGVVVSRLKARVRVRWTEKDGQRTVAVLDCHPDDLTIEETP